MSDAERALKPANENPWYILMTLYGEQEGDWGDDDLHEQNRDAWNAWACQAMEDAERIELAEDMELDVETLRAWGSREGEIREKFSQVWLERNGPDIPCPELPDVADLINMSKITFFNIVVLKNVIFTNEALFLSTTFADVADFSYAKFTRGAFFSDITFAGDAYFSSATFTRDALFSGTTFKGNVYFFSVAFTRDALFSYTTFTSYAYFTKAIFGTKDEITPKSAVTFNNCQFQMPLSFRDAEFRDVYPDFSGAILHDSATFTASDENWPSRSQGDPAQARASCATIRHAVGKQGLPEDEHFFYRKEMYFAGQIGRLWQWMPYRAFGLVSNYGESIWRPSVGLFALWMIPALVYMVYFNWIGAFGGMEGQTVGTFDAFSLSFAAMFKFLGLQSLHFGAEYIRALPPFLEFLTAAQTLGGIILLFFLGLGLRTRFRLR